MMRVVEAIPDYGRRVCRLELLILLAIAFLLSEKGLFPSEADSEDRTADLKLQPSKGCRPLRPESFHHPEDSSSLSHMAVFLEDVPGELHGRRILADSASSPMATSSDVIVAAQSPGSPAPPAKNDVLP
ncbi:hypothetical protein MPTK1_3g05230 [Marchantia polymorpha subsp. ruderalis]|uniref:Uncharacterized protein n=3 Tax=Marchantia polymorpha TaxID=3197 RepID=A0AAF6AXL9_MARPO|nr:hypothetical protein MARPO_0022s0005 [Marchantia polymorpha]BBN04503.1 hypothetical protein Mp_3g05230 [Marchantia polymorpha subsp. ruderalis]|eukprot:PTQ43897.1 hypothetical protein MARPO_0022s0005 [Marchantia polymorpha]